MKEIRLNNIKYIRGNIKSATIDEEELKFINGVALVEATIVENRGGTDTTYKCFGLIDEEFNEVYADQSKIISNMERNLMFFRYNNSAERFSDDDYIVEVACRADDRTWTEYRHIRIIDGIPMLINKLGGKPMRTKKEGLVIVDLLKWKVLYDINKCVFITPGLVSIKEADNNGDLFDVTARVTSESTKNDYELVDYLFFKINSSGQVVTSILSSLENGYLTISEACSTEELIKNRKQSLAVRETQFSEEVTEFRSTISSISREGLDHAIKMNPVGENN